MSTSPTLNTISVSAVKLPSKWPFLQQLLDLSSKTICKSLDSFWFIGGGNNTEGRPAFPDITEKARSHQHLMKNEKLTDFYTEVIQTRRHVFLIDSSWIWFLPLWSAGWSLVAPTSSFCRKDSSVWQGIWLEMDSRYIRTKRSASVSTKRWLKTEDQTREMKLRFKAILTMNSLLEHKMYLDSSIYSLVPGPRMVVSKYSSWKHR